jgi:Na+-transporting methylmalonyl-CoA/oxaloacetate decarboxylase gamma subunit
MLENFKLGLEVTGWGMGLVFLALVLVMLAIYALDRIFKPEVVSEETLATEPNKVAQASLPNLVAEAAAIAVAITLEKRDTVSTVTETEPTENLVGDTVTVALIDPGSPGWRSSGRLRAMK